jgi:hypothetical protein
MNREGRTIKVIEARKKRQSDRKEREVMKAEKRLRRELQVIIFEVLETAVFSCNLCVTYSHKNFILIHLEEMVENVEEIGLHLNFSS